MPSLIAIALTLSLFLSAQPADAAIYSYKDENGRTVFVDDEHKIPSQYRGNSTTVQERRALPQADATSEGDGEKAEPEGQVYFDRATQMKAREQAQQLERQRASQTPAMIRGSRVMVPVVVAVGDRTAHLMLLLDPGATYTVLHRAAVKELPFQAGKATDVKVAGGRKIKAEPAMTQHLDIGPYILKDFPVMLITPQSAGLPYDGLLGMDFLKDHPYEVNFDSEMVYWKAQP